MPTTVVNSVVRLHERAEKRRGRAIDPGHPHIATKPLARPAVGDASRQADCSRCRGESLLQELAFSMSLGKTSKSGDGSALPS